MIIYFSGTGNSYSVAKNLAEKLQDKCVPLINLRENKDFDLSRESSIGIVFPVYFGDMPDPLVDFIKNGTFNRETYFYGVATCGSSGGIALHHLSEILQTKGCKISYGKLLPMIANSTATWKKNVTYDFHRLDKEQPFIEAVAKAVQERKRDTSALGGSLLGSILASDFVKSWGLKRFAISVDFKACMGCGMCVRLCPNHNLELKDNKAAFGSNCAYCMACVHNCPHGGILVNGHIIKKENQYHHPDISIQEMFLRGVM